MPRRRRDTNVAPRGAFCATSGVNNLEEIRTPAEVQGSFWDSMELPRISIVTPSYNQGKFIEQTIRSVVDQGYPNLEYIIIDGGSKDESVDIIRRYEKHVTYWVSEKDDGAADAISKGF